MFVLCLFLLSCSVSPLEELAALGTQIADILQSSCVAAADESSSTARESSIATAAYPGTTLVTDLFWRIIFLPAFPLPQKRSGDPNPQYFSKSTAVQMGGVLPYKWEAYCSTNGRRIAGFPFLRSLEARKVRRYKWGAYCRTNWRV